MELILTSKYPSLLLLILSLVQPLPHMDSPNLLGPNAQNTKKLCAYFPLS